MTPYEEILAMDDTIDFVDNLASEMDERATKLQLQLETLEQLLVVEEYRKTEKQCKQISKWLKQLQKIYEVMDNCKEKTVDKE
jgi:3'-phosphoadenosine 5'-phosphosulfate sulfotransferase (PAPS reductase)/FAD synthetase